MSTEKWYTLHYAWYEMRDGGRMTYLHAGIFESAHKLFKNICCKSSNKARTKMKEVAI